MFIVIEVSDPTAITVMRSHDAVTVREVATGNSLADLMNAIEDAEYAACRERRELAAIKHGTSDLVLRRRGAIVDAKPPVFSQDPDDDDLDDDDATPTIVGDDPPGGSD